MSSSCLKGSYYHSLTLTIFLLWWERWHLLSMTMTNFICARSLISTCSCIDQKSEVSWLFVGHRKNLNPSDTNYLITILNLMSFLLWFYSRDLHHATSLLWPRLKWSLFHDCNQCQYSVWHFSSLAFFPLNHPLLLHLKSSYMTGYTNYLTKRV